MVQVITTERKPSVGAAFGAGLGSGIARGVETGLNMKLNEMLQAKQEAKQNAAYMDYAMQLGKVQGNGDKDLEASYASLYYTAMKTGGPDALKHLENISPQQMEHFAESAKAHRNDQNRQYQQPIQQQAPPPSGPSLEEIAKGSKAAPEALRIFLLSTQSNVGHPGSMPNPKLTEDQIRLISAYLSSLRNAK